MRKLILMLVTGLVAAAIGTGTAFAGELKGNGEENLAMREHANSECAFSGLDDADDDGFVHTQSWGQLPKGARDAITADGGSPGIACNGHLNPRK